MTTEQQQQQIDADRREQLKLLVYQIRRDGFLRCGKGRNSYVDTRAVEEDDEPFLLPPRRAR